MADLKELRLQKQVAKILDMTKLDWFHPSNEGKRTGWGQANLKLTGVKSGVPDILIFNSPTGARFVPFSKGLAIELKIGNNKLRDSQKAWRIKLESCGWAFYVCYTIEEVINVLEKFYPDCLKHIKF